MGTTVRLGELARLAIAGLGSCLLDSEQGWARMRGTGALVEEASRMGKLGAAFVGELVWWCAGDPMAGLSVRGSELCWQASRVSWCCVA